jgi:glycosyltransferase involved in cell wall biosynthesis
MRRFVRSAAVVVTVSEAIKKEIVDEFKVSPDDVVVVSPGVDAARFGHGNPRPKDLPDRYLLFVGTIEPRKNLRNVLKAYALLRDRLEDPPALVVAGGRGWRDAQLPELPSGVHMLGYVEQSDLAGMYSNAEALVFPSFYEGFGLPIVEAMAAGTAVITSGRGALAEVAGEAALFVDPDDPVDIASALQDIVEKPDLRADLISKGAVRVRSYTWEKTGIALRAAIERAVGPEGKRAR